MAVLAINVARDHFERVVERLQLEAWTARMEKRSQQVEQVLEQAPRVSPPLGGGMAGRRP